MGASVQEKVLKELSANLAALMVVENCGIMEQVTKHLMSPQVLKSLKLISVRVLNEDIKKVNLRSRS